MKKARWTTAALCALALGITAVVGPGCSSKSEANEEAIAKIPAGKYYCPMHPNEVQDKPGKCHECGADLVQKK